MRIPIQRAFDYLNAVRLKNQLAELGDARVTRRERAIEIQQKVDAAEVLWSAGMRSEALSAIRAAKGLADGVAFEKAPLEKDLGRAHEAEFAESLTAVSKQWAKTLRFEAMTDGEIARIRFTRWAVAAGVGFVVLGAFAWLLRPPPAVSVSASGYLIDSVAIHYTPDRVLDGDPRTDWLLPDTQPGWVKFRFRNERSLRGVAITNGVNSPHNDRGARRFRIEYVDSNGRVIRQHEGELEFSIQPTVQHINMAGEQVREIRLHVLSCYQLSSAVAEVRWW